MHFQRVSPIGVVRIGCFCIYSTSGFFLSPSCVSLGWCSYAFDSTGMADPKFITTIKRSDGIVVIGDNSELTIGSQKPEGKMIIILQNLEFLVQIAPHAFQFHCLII